MKRALVIDSSVFARRNFTTVLKKAGYDVTTANTAQNGLRLAKTINPALITLDMGVTDMNGLDCLQMLKSSVEHPIVVTAEQGEHSHEMSKAVRVHGAEAAIQKPSAWDIVHDARAVDDLISTINRATAPRPKMRRTKDRAGPGAAPKPGQTPIAKPGQINAARPGQATVARPGQPTAPKPSATPRVAPQQPSPQGRPGMVRPQATTVTAGTQSRFRSAGSNFPIYLIGSSTGGPNALQAILPRLSKDFPAAIVIAQHMPKRFTAAFAKRMNGMMELTAQEADKATEVRSGNCYIATGGSDLVFSNRNGKIFVAPDTPEEGSLWTPSVDRMVSSAIRAVQPKRLRGIQLTGIGNDGAKAMTELYKLGSQVIAESKESSVVFGMPGNLITMGGASIVLHHKDIAKKLMETVQ